MRFVNSTKQRDCINWNCSNWGIPVSWFFVMNNPYTHCVSGCKRKHWNVLWSYLPLWHRIGIDLQQTRRHLELHDSQSCFLKTCFIYFRNKMILKVAWYQNVFQVWSQVLNLLTLAENFNFSPFLINNLFNFLLKEEIWHHSLAMGSKSKNLLKFSHL